MRTSDALEHLSYFRLDQLNEGDTFVFWDSISENDVNAFSKLSGDISPLHMSSDYAVKAGFSRGVVHGVLAAGLVSRMIGVHLPGANSIISNMSLKFMRPIIAGTDLEICGVVDQISPSIGVIVVKVVVTSLDRNIRYLRSDVTVKVRL